ncbi:MAG: hypothetical protein AB7F31_00145 [Parachlamydiales bacterium]
MKRHALLVELLVGLTLTATLIGGLLALIVRLTSLSHDTDKRLEPVVASCTTHVRLYQVLSESLLIEGGIFSLRDKTLLFTYNRGVDPDPLFSADVLGELALEGSNLTLTTWPHPRHPFEETPPCRIETVASGVETLTYFLLNSAGEWVKGWEESRLPILIRLKINEEAHTFPLYHADAPLTFPRKER